MKKKPSQLKFAKKKHCQVNLRMNDFSSPQMKVLEKAFCSNLEHTCNTTSVLQVYYDRKCSNSKKTRQSI